ncbi:MAG: endonuclease [Bacteroidales bacterium]|nr:endonuclease [Bacteroidales bacterium]
MMRRLSVYLAALMAVFAIFSLPCRGKAGIDLKILYWNIQNGMWSDQGGNYDRFVAYVKDLDPDICIWCEAESRYLTDTSVKMQMPEDQYLPWNWDLLAARYGHKYTLVCGKRDTFPQVITSKYPLHIVKRVTGNGEDMLVVHGAGWAVADLGRGRELNIVTLHTWPQRYAYMAEDQKQSAAEHGGDYFRAAEIKYICSQTAGTVPGMENQWWLMTGDFNAISSADNFHYALDPADPAFLVHDYVRTNTPYIDVIERLFPGEFKKSTVSGRRIDMMYVTPALFRRVKSADVLYDGFAASSRDPRGKAIHNFCHPSDHYPVWMVIKL